MPHWVPWGAVRELGVQNDLLVVLTDGSVIRPSVGQGSLASAMRGNRSQRALRDRIDKLRAQAPEVPATSVERKLQLGVIRMVALFAVFFAILLVRRALM
ncbi:hypothetical protein SacmaDRAFT_2338 [Saccharomonospora marina XMU15]|uniref:Uncharacterized protein n=2 Tax=Saccharomonospora TaxID=1851 RepID=H5WXI6_9PSEU|nr:hypothetical protein SacmaDRAFT_2338 [Saccharomonospora marina XMU15]